VVDRSQDVRHSVAPSGTRYRITVWNSRRENHLGQRSCATAETGHMIASDPVRTLPSSCRPGAVHIWVPRTADKFTQSAQA
jgi:hypothetical protein